MLSIYTQGLFMGAGLIIAIGAQNAFVLVQAVKRQHHFLLAAICALIDAILIIIGVLGVGTFIAENIWLHFGASLLGGLFLIYFGLRSFRSIFISQALQTDYAANAASLRSVLITLFAVTLLNPHVYLDTVIMLGAISGTFGEVGRFYFGAGAATASVLWFFSLALLGSKLAPVFARPRAWQVLYCLVALMMWRIGFGLLWDAWQCYPEL